MELISTHVGADFDAFASVYLARKLYPDAHLFFPGSREESVRRMLESGYLELQELRQKEIDPGGLIRVVLCDIRQPDRIGILASWLRKRPDIELVIYDHHPDAPGDLAGVGGRVDPHVGSTSTLISEELAEREIDLTPQEASLLLMGIYEDTGALSHPGTHPRDFEAAARLMRQGGDLAAVRLFALRSLDARRLDILHRMTREVEVHRIQGHRVGVVALELGAYVDELAPLVNRCLEICGLPILFALFGETDRVTVIARGESESCDLGQVLSDLGAGGGHPTAAAGSFRRVTALEARERLLEHLEGSLPPAARARDLMLRSFAAVPGGASVGEAKQLLVERRVNAAPVLGEGERGEVLGTVTRQLLDAALQHELEDRPVSSVMDRELVWAAPDAPVEELAAMILERHPRFVLVGDAPGSRPLGLVTRMDVLRHLFGGLEVAGEPLERRLREERDRHTTVQRLLDERLEPKLRHRLEIVAEVSRRHGIPVYLVGGMVRDLMLERENRDVDLVVEGDGPHFARLLSEELGGRVRVHRPFLTAVVVAADGFHIDVATARSEFYRAPAALPEIQSGALRQDLYRRDFTINTLAIRLGPREPIELLDFFGGGRDIRRRVLRVLHGLSFIDDPTRVLRAVRLERRLGFQISQETRHLIEVALEEGVFRRLSGNRLREELLHLLNDPMTAVQGIERLAELGVLPVLAAELQGDTGLSERLRKTEAALDWYLVESLSEPPVHVGWLFLLSLAWGLSADAVERLGQRLALTGERALQLADARGRVDGAGAALRAAFGPPHRAAEALRSLSGEELLLLMAVGGEGEVTWVRRWFTELSRLRLEIGGAELRAAGVPPGPAIGRALRRTWEARADGRIEARQELEFALGVIRTAGNEDEPGAGDGGPGS